MNAIRITTLTGLVVSVAALSFPAAAQQREIMDRYLGLSLGHSSFETSCGGLGLSCSDDDNSYKLSYGGRTNEHFGGEISLVDFGRLDRAGGTTRANGGNISLLGRLPFGPVGIFGKVGATYARSKVSAAPGATISQGTESGFGRSFGAGVSWDINPSFGLVAEWERHAVKFAGTGKDDIDNTSIGVRYRF